MGGNVPVPLTSLIGRARELDGMIETLRRTRLVTVTGPGGVGKTRLATELARRQVGRRADGVWLVDLTAGPAEPDPAGEVARALDVGGRSSRAPLASLREYVADRDMLVVIDNCEHVIDGCAELASSLLGSCRRVRILATSREPLGVTGETVWRLDALEPDDAQRLFVERARQRDPRFIPSDEEAATIAALCERLDRLPLPIELAAARIGVMSPAEILADLDARLGALGGGPRLAHARHRTVRATVEWSYDLLDDDERRAFRSMAVFVGGFDAAAAMAVVPGLTVDVFARLVDKSVVVARATARGTTRYRLLETVREYARELLVAGDELDAVRERHLRHFGALEDEESFVGWPPWRAESFLAEHEDDYENVRAALEWAAESDPCKGMRLLAGTKDLFFMLGQADGRRITGELLVRCPARDRVRVTVLITAGLLAMLTANAVASEAYLVEAQELAVRLGATDFEGFANLHRGLTAMLNLDVEGARPRLIAARALLERSGNAPGQGLATAVLGMIHALSGEPERGRELLEEALAIHKAAGYLWGEGHACLYLGTMLGDAEPESASRRFRRAVDCFRPYRDSTLLPYALIGQAAVIANRDPAAALRVIAAATEVRARVGGEFSPLYADLQRRARAKCEAALGDGAERVWSDGSRLGVEDAIALAFGTPRPRAAAPAGLSARELDVVRLVAAGETNKAIAAHLHVSVRTVESHVRNVLAKARVQNRTQLAAWAHEHVQ